MAETKTCSRCGYPIEEDVLQGLCPRCVGRWALSDEPEDEFWRSRPELLSELFPHLQILNQIGRGGMGLVLKARQPGLDRLVAIKILPARAEQSGAFAERFVQEAKALGRLNHPNIVTVYDFGQTEDFFYLTMEYVPGLTLRELIRQGTLTPKKSLAIISQVCEALQYAHAQGFVHRDIKPENILVDEQGHVKVADFGLAKLLQAPSDELHVTEIRQVVGTTHYMAPEQTERPQEVDHRADIYSAGVILYELLTGELPLGHFALPSEKIQADFKLDEILLKTLEKDPARRYSDAGQLKADLKWIEVKSAPAGIESVSADLRKRFKQASALALILWGIWAVALGWIGIGDLQNPHGLGYKTEAEGTVINVAFAGLLLSGMAWFYLLYKKYQLQDKLLSWPLQRRVLGSVGGFALVWIAAFGVGMWVDPLRGATAVLLGGAILGPAISYGTAWYAVRREYGQPVLRFSQQVFLIAGMVCLLLGIGLVSHFLTTGLLFQLVGGLVYLGTIAFRYRASARIAGEKRRGRVVFLAFGLLGGMLWTASLSPEVHPEIRHLLSVPSLFLALFALSIGPVLMKSLNKLVTLRNLLEPEVFVVWFLLASMCLPFHILPPISSSQLRQTIATGQYRVSLTSASPDGRVLAFVALGGRVELRAREGGYLRSLSGLGGLSSLAWSPDGLAVAGGSREIVLWQVGDGKLISRFRSALDPVRVSSLAFAPDGITLAAGLEDGAVEIWDTAAYSGVQEADAGPLPDTQRVPGGAEGERLLGGRGAAEWRRMRLSAHDGRLWDLAANEPPRRLAGGILVELVQKWHHLMGRPFGPILGVAFSPDGQLLAGLLQDRIEIFHAASGEQLGRLKGHRRDASFVAFLPDGSLLTGSSREKTIRIWEMEEF